MTSPALQRKAYEPAVRAMVPGCEDEELHRRSVLCLIRDGAGRMKERCAAEVWPIYDVIERAASANAYRAMPLDDLRDLQLILTLLAAQTHDLKKWCEGGPLWGDGPSA